MIYPQNGSYVYHIYENEGLYLITATIFDGIMTTKTMVLIEVLNKIPEVSIQKMLNASQDEEVELGDKFSYTDSGSDVESLRFYWEFGDGMFSPYLNVSHKWCQNGLMPLTLHVIDDNGADGAFTRIINITNFDPVIEGPFGFQGAEGRAITLEMAVFDNFGDEVNLDYMWDIAGQLINEPRPTLFLDDGNYTAYLSVSDENGAESCANITIIVEDLPPTVTTTSKIIYGKPGEISLKAYAIDSYIDTDEMIFNWNINNETYHQHVGGFWSELIYSYDSNSIITGQVEVVDDAGKVGHTLFRLEIYIDSDGDGLSDEYEIQQDYSPDSDDTDGDFITDWYEIYVTNTDPANPDTDGDGLPDGYGLVEGQYCGELLLGTDPLNSDTDNDNLTDGVEFFGWTISTIWYDSETGEQITKTYWTNSDPLLIDTDKDLLFDDEEYDRGTDPRVRDTDNDGRDDYKDYFPNRYDGDGDGLSDKKEAKMGTDPGNPDTDDDGLSDGEEYYPGEDGYITDPNDEDCDNDGLLDGEELYTATTKINSRKKISIGTNEYSLDLNEGIRMYAASVTMSVSVGELSEELADLTVELIVQGISIFEKDYENQRYLADITDVKDLVDNQVGRYGGKWVLYITSNTECVLEEFTVDVVKYLNPLNPDFDGDGISDGEEYYPGDDGWITDPTKYDTDGDSISDYVEIDNGWNPNSVDTDGDGLEDWRDIDPLGNVIVEIEVDKGLYDVPFPYTADPRLQVTLEVHTDTEHKYELATPDEKADDDEKRFTMPWLEWRWAWHCIPYYSCHWSWSKMRVRCKRKYFCFRFLEPYWTTITIDKVYTGAHFGQKYYVDVNEEKNNILIKAQLWLEVLGGWTPVSFGVYNYEVMDGNTPNEVYDEKLYNIFGGNNYVKLDIRTERVERINTIAIREFDDEFNAGTHYSQPEKMAVVMLNVNGNDPFSDFNPGFNAILIPTRIFVNTQLHAFIERCVDENGIIVIEEWEKINDPNSVYFAIKNAEVSGVDRVTLKEEISPNVECVIKKAVSIDQAEKILEQLILTGADESEGEVYTYSRSSRPEELGLAPDVLALIPLLAAQYVNDEVGEWPRTPWDNFIQLVQAVVEFIIDVFIAIATFFVELGNAIIEIGMCIAEAILDTAIAFIEMLLKALAMVHIYLLLALITFVFSITFPIIALSLISVNKDLGGTGTSDLFSIDLNFQDNEIEFLLEFKWRYDEDLDLDVPYIEASTQFNGELENILELDIIDSTVLSESYEFGSGEFESSILSSLNLASITKEQGKYPEFQVKGSQQAKTLTSLELMQILANAPDIVNQISVPLQNTEDENYDYDNLYFFVTEVVWFLIGCVIYIYLRIDYNLKKDKDYDFDPPTDYSGNTLILVHGFNDKAIAMEEIYDDEDYQEYYQNIINIEYYDNPGDMGENFYIRTPIQDIAEAIAEYIIDNDEYICDNVDFVCHSMGGIIIRYMIKHYIVDIIEEYGELSREFSINNICMLGTPNHGTWIGWITIGVYQGIQMKPDSQFLENLNDFDETPYSELYDIKYYTYRGDEGYGHDGLVYADSVILYEDDATNRGPYDLGHVALLKNNELRSIIFDDLT
ncbi:MAG: hypothetical protein EU529_01830 [Promethearchaeota archaeon]|nr:MAG: hypothetical protein EU529_01830 [Candidatus Lokiarchaeota archaeon]